MKTFSLICLLIFCVNCTLSAQFECSADEQHEIFIKKSEENRDRYDNMNFQVLSKILDNRESQDKSMLPNVIPVVIHVIHNNNGPENIDLAQGEQAIEWLNNAYANVGTAFNPGGVEIPIEFCLAKKDPDGNFSLGINYLESELTDMFVPSNDQEL